MYRIERDSMIKTRIAASTALAIVAATTMALAACSVDKNPRVELDETPIISGGLGWGVVSLSYARLMLEPSLDAADSGTCRRGDVGELLARTRVAKGRDGGVWYRARFDGGTGWLHESALAVFRTENEARNAVEARP
ncbi:MAG TPA: hypothetical protein PLQ29_02810 [Spirochaetales bacterium]|nr:hypothetical protein [Spirochaetales bacterium]